MRPQRRAPAASGESGPPAAPCLGALRAQLRSRAHDNAEESQLAHASLVTVAAVAAFWRRLGGDVPMRPAPIRAMPLPEHTMEAARRFGEAVAGLRVVDAAYHIGLLYTGLLPPEWRASRGIYYTPPALADRLLDQAQAASIDWSRAHVVDPAAGAGAFLLPTAERMVRALGDCAPALIVQNIRARLRGYELDPFAAWLAHVFLEALVLPHVIESGRRLDGLIDVRDSLAVDPQPTFDLVVGNPPFGRQSLDEAKRNRFARSLYGHANLYGMFMDLAVQLAKPVGVVSFLTPSSFLAGEYFKNLRALMSREAPPTAIDFVTARKGVFEDVLQETVLATYRKGGTRAPVKICFLSPSGGPAVRAESAGTASLPRDPHGPWLLPRHADEARLAKRLRSLQERLADWGYRVSTGPLVWNRYKPQLLDAPESGAVPLVWAEAVTRDGRFVFEYAKRNHKPYFRVEPGDEWMIVRRPCVLLQRTTAKEQARRLIAAELPPSFLKKHSGITVENHLNMLVPLSETPAVSPRVLAAFLNAAAADRAFRCISGSVAVSAYELESLPLPPVNLIKRKLRGRTDRETVARVAEALYREDAEP